MSEKKKNRERKSLCCERKIKGKMYSVHNTTYTHREKRREMVNNNKKKSLWYKEKPEEKNGILNRENSYDEKIRKCFSHYTIFLLSSEFSVYFFLFYFCTWHIIGYRIETVSFFFFVLSFCIFHVNLIFRCLTYIYFVCRYSKCNYMYMILSNTFLFSFDLCCISVFLFNPLTLHLTLIGKLCDRNEQNNSEMEIK